MSPAVADRPAVRPRRAPRVRRWTPLSQASVGLAVVLAAVGIFVPGNLSANGTQQLTNLLVLILLAAMWNALAGFGGLISIGQQAFIGLGAYGTVWFVQHGQSPFMGMLLATLLCGAVSLPMSALVLRLRPVQFAIGMWVIAEVMGILVSFDSGLGAGTGTSLIEFDYYLPATRQEYTYWWALGAAVVALVVLFVLLRSSIGASMQAIRDDDGAAESLGVRVMLGKRILFVIAALGCGAGGALLLATTLFIEPSSIFGVQWTAEMIFMVLVGGLGTFEGPILGAIVLWLVQIEWVGNGTIYMGAIGLTSIVFALYLPRGIWGTVVDRFGVRLLPVGYQLVTGGERDEGGGP